MSIVVDPKWLINQVEWPPALVKALSDEFTYMCELDCGDRYHFTRAQYLNTKFVRLVFADKEPYPRGLEVRVDKIVLVSDGGVV